jgi:pyruvate-ferredoxin/flavodoxin oxidoreductase
MGARINTIMQTCFFAISGVLPRDEAIAKIKDAIKKTYGKQGRRGRPQELRRGRPTLANLHEVRCPARSPAPSSCRRSSARRRRSSSRRSPRDHGRRGDDCCRSAPSRSTAPSPPARPVGEAQHRLEIPVWDPEVCIQCGKCALVCPHAAIRAEGLRPESDLERAGDLQVVDFKRKDLRGLEVHRSRSRPRTAPAAASASRSARRRTRASRSTRPSTWSQPPLRERSGELRVLPRPARVDRTEAQHRHGQGLAVARAAVRVLRRLRRLRRDALRQAAQPALRRPHDDRQRHRLLVDLRRQPADHALAHERRRPRPGLVNSLFEDNAEFGFGMRLRSTSRPRTPVSCTEAGRRIGDDLVDRPPRGRPETSRHRRAARAGRGAAQKLADLNDARARRLPARAGRLPRPQERLDRRRRRLGLRHRLRRPRPRAGHGARRQRPGARHRGLLQHRRPGLQGDAARCVGQVRRRRQADPQEGPRPDGDVLRQRLRGAIAMGAKDAQTVKAFLEAESYPGPSMIIAYSPASPTA